MVMASLNNSFAKEMSIRKRIASIFNKREDDFPSLRDYNDYLEEVEDLTFNLIEGIDVPAIEAKIAKYQDENAEQIINARARKAEELATALEDSKKVHVHPDASNGVEKIPQSFDFLDQYLKSYVYPLLEETRAELCSNMEVISYAPSAEVISFKRTYLPGYYEYEVEVDFWTNRQGIHNKDPYKPKPGDIYVLSNAIPETASDLQRYERTWDLEKEVVKEKVEWWWVRGSVDGEVNLYVAGLPLGSYNMYWQEEQSQV